MGAPHWLSQAQTCQSSVWKEPWGCLYPSELLQVAVGGKWPAVSTLTVSTLEHFLNVSCNSVNSRVL